MKFCSIHNHTEFSNVKLRDCIIKIPDLVSKAIEYGYQGIAITDHEVLSGHVQAMELGDKIKEQYPYFKIILGNEIYLIDESDYQNTDNFFHFILLAKDLTGYEQIRKLSSRAWERSYTSKGILRTPTFYQDFNEIIGKNKGHLIASTACLGGEVGWSILNKDSARLNKFVNWMIETFEAQNCFLEMQDSDSEEQKRVNSTILKMGDYFNLPVIITSDAHYLNKEDIKIHHAFLNSKEEKERETESFYRYTYVKTESEIYDILSYLPKEDVERALNNTMNIYDAVENFDFRHPTIVPEIKIDLPISTIENISFELMRRISNYPIILKYKNSEYLQDKFLLYQIDRGLNEKGFWEKGEEYIQKALQRIDTELDVVWNISEFHHQRMSAYLNLVRKIVGIIWKVSLLGVARGSAGGFLINYLIGITQINPLDFDLPYWRFLNNERLDDFPDIDLDIDPTKTEEVIQMLREEFGKDNVLNTITFKTETLKSAILTAARGMGINNDEAQFLSSLVVVERGKVATLDMCLGKQEGETPIPGFKEAFNKYPGLLETVAKIEGLISGRGIHASSVYIFNNGYLAQNSLMRAPNKTLITAFDMHDSDSLGSLKFDLLRTDAQTKLTKCLELLLENKQIEWQGSLKATYDKYLGINNIDLSNPQLWDNINKGLVPDLFQFETQVGSVGIQKIQPHSILEMSLTNDAMRLQGTLDGLSPIERFSKFKKNVSLWFKEMEQKGLSLEEQEVLKKYVLSTYGNSINQETLMRLLMEPQISNFSLREANNARKILAKKLLNKVEGLKDSFFLKGASNGARKIFLDYVWAYFIEPQMGYSFSSIHSHSYSLIGLQEAYLATAFNPLYWSCACLSINSGAETETLEDLVSEDLEAEEENEEINNEDEFYSESEKQIESKKKNVVTDYGKIAKAIGNIQSRGIKVLLPDINKAENDFIPDIENSAIIYGLQAINGINSDIINEIQTKRPFSSFCDFIARTEFSLVQNINLIKAGCFDKLKINEFDRNTALHRRDIMNYYLNSVGEKLYPLKNELTMANFNKIKSLGIIPLEFDIQQKIICFKKWIEANCVKKEGKTKYYYLTEEDEIKFFNNVIKKMLTYEKDYVIINADTIAVKSAAFNKAYDILLSPLKEWMNLEETLVLFRKAQIAEYVNSIYEKYCEGNNSRWEMDSVSFYATKHELQGTNLDFYGVVDFNKLPESPIILSYTKSKEGNIEYPKYQIDNIAGTIVNVNKNKYIVSILTLSGVVDVKLFKFSFIYYNKKISKTDSDGKKIVLENSWLSRGNKIIVSGYRKENSFIAKSSSWKDPAIRLITGISQNKIITKKERLKA